MEAPSTLLGGAPSFALPTLAVASYPTALPGPTAATSLPQFVRGNGYAPGILSPFAALAPHALPAVARPLVTARLPIDQAMAAWLRSGERFVNPVGFVDPAFESGDLEIPLSLGNGATGFSPRAQTLADLVNPHGTAAPSALPKLVWRSGEQDENGLFSARLDGNPAQVPTTRARQRVTFGYEFAATADRRNRGDVAAGLRSYISNPFGAPITALGLPTNVTDSLSTSGVFTLGDLLGRTRLEVQAIPGIGFEEDWKPPTRKEDAKAKTKLPVTPTSPYPAIWFIDEAVGALTLEFGVSYRHSGSDDLEVLADRRYFPEPLAVPSATVRALLKGGVRTISQLSGMTRGQVGAIPGIGFSGTGLLRLERTLSAIYTTEPPINITDPVTTASFRALSLRQPGPDELESLPLDRVITDERLARARQELIPLSLLGRVDTTLGADDLQLLPLVEAIAVRSLDDSRGRGANPLRNHPETGKQTPPLPPGEKRKPKGAPLPRTASFQPEDWSRLEEAWGEAERIFTALRAQGVGNLSAAVESRYEDFVRLLGSETDADRVQEAVNLYWPYRGEGMQVANRLVVDLGASGVDSVSTLRTLSPRHLEHLREDYDFVTRGTDGTERRRWTPRGSFDDKGLRSFSGTEAGQLEAALRRQGMGLSDAYRMTLDPEALQIPDDQLSAGYYPVTPGTQLTPLPPRPAQDSPDIDVFPVAEPNSPLNSLPPEVRAYLGGPVVNVDRLHLAMTLLGRDVAVRVTVVPNDSAPLTGERVGAALARARERRVITLEDAATLAAATAESGGTVLFQLADLDATQTESRPYDGPYTTDYAEQRLRNTPNIERVRDPRFNTARWLPTDLRPHDSPVVVLLVPGAGGIWSNGASMAHTAHELATRFGLYAFSFDPPFNGDGSQDPALRQVDSYMLWLNRLVLSTQDRHGKPVAIVGRSTGADTAEEYAFRHPGTVQRVVSISGGRPEYIQYNMEALRAMVASGETRLNPASLGWVTAIEPGFGHFDADMSPMALGGTHILTMAGTEDPESPPDHVETKRALAIKHGQSFIAYEGARHNILARPQVPPGEDPAVSAMYAQNFRADHAHKTIARFVGRQLNNAPMEPFVTTVSRADLLAQVQRRRLGRQ